MAPYAQCDGTFFVMVGIHLIKQFPLRIILKQSTDHQEPKMGFGVQLFQNAQRPFFEGARIIDIS